jgi:hypothetical protein
VFQDGERLVQALQFEISGSDALEIVGREFGPADLGLKFFQLMMQSP